MRRWLENVMRGRYGMDQLGRFPSFLTIALLIVSLFVPNRFLFFAPLLLLIYSYFRMLSRNTYKRAAENQVYLKLTRPIRQRCNTIKRDMQIRKTHHLYRCPSCKQKIRVPKGKGRIMVRCPKCRREFQKNS